MTTEEELRHCRRLLGWVHERSRHGCSSFKGSERTAALSDVNFWTVPYAGYYNEGRMMPISKDKQWCGETP